MDTVTSMAKVAVVTRASRGAGKGIAIALAVFAERGHE
jgi:NAD(P)-dependent dehydrogenase (short-subunit alcohol dehydrogenase family)